MLKLFVALSSTWKNKT